MNTPFRADEAVKGVEGTLRIIMELSCLARDRKWRDFIDKIIFQELPKIRDKRGTMNQFFLFR